MSLRDSVVATGVVTVAATTVAVVLVGQLPDGPGRLAAQVVMGALGVGLHGLVARKLILELLEEQVRRLSDAVRRSRDPDDVDPDLVALARTAREHDLGRLAEIEEVRSSNRAAWEVLDSSPFAIAILDRETRISWANRTFRTMLRLRGEPVGRLPIEVVAHAELHDVVEETGLTGERAERSFTTETQDLVTWASPLGDGRIVLRIEDVTTQREAERARTDFVANVSHELRTPVAATLGYLDLALSDPDRLPEDVVPLLETADRNARRLRDLFEDLLRLHRIEVRRRQLPMHVQALRPILEEATGPVKDKAAFRKQSFTLDCPDDLVALVNPEALGAMVGNLASNASAYSGEGGHVRVVARAEARGARIDVIDDGIGIPERHHERIFERFYRVDEARSRKVGGTGLGLAIVKHYALASGCRIELQSQEGKGSTFTLHLPTR